MPSPRRPYALFRPLEDAWLAAISSSLLALEVLSSAVGIHASRRCAATLPRLQELAAPFLAGGRPLRVLAPRLRRCCVAVVGAKDAAQGGGASGGAGGSGGGCFTGGHPSLTDLALTCVAGLGGVEAQLPAPPGGDGFDPGALALMPQLTRLILMDGNGSAATESQVLHWAAACGARPESDSGGLRELSLGSALLALATVDGGRGQPARPLDAGLALCALAPALGSCLRRLTLDGCAIGDAAAGGSSSRRLEGALACLPLFRALEELALVFHRQSGLAGEGGGGNVGSSGDPASTDDALLCLFAPLAQTPLLPALSRLRILLPYGGGDGARLSDGFQQRVADAHPGLWRLLELGYY